jgi:nucleoside-diphosphate-sugar epimerase
LRVLVTGGFGNVGSHVVAELVRRGHAVRVLELRTRRTERMARAMRSVRRGPDGVEVVWGSVADRPAVGQAVTGVDVVLHMAAVIPPESDEQPERARVTNVDGTATVIAACRAQPTPPRLLFVSTFDVHGHTQHRTPPRRVDDPVEATDPYTTHKIECEALVRASGLRWCLIRLADVPIIGLRPPHPIMFEIGPHNRIEALHPDDAALALVNALDEPKLWGTVHFIGGGASCQVTYREYLTKILGAMGISALPDSAFAQTDYATDWLDTVESEALLRYQRHSFDDIVAQIAAAAGWRRHAVRMVAPLARRFVLRLSPYVQSY